MTKRDTHPHAHAGNAGEAREAADKAPRADTDRWAQFSKRDVDDKANDPASPPEAEKPLAGLARDGGQVEGD